MANFNESEYSSLGDAFCETENTNPGWCPQTFDSILCWPETPPGTIANQSCPRDSDGAGAVNLAFKECLVNGSWYINSNNITWTNYEHCARSSDEVLEFYKCINFLYIIGYSISSVALLVSLAIFISFRTLRCVRIRIHVQLFISFLVNNILAIIWYTEVVTKVEITNENPVPAEMAGMGLSGELTENIYQLWCQFLHIAKEYFMVANYMWMFCEALHLHIALVVVFVTEEKTMKWFYSIGWGIPFPILLVHNLVRIYYSQDTGRCYMEEITFSTWFISVPIVITLAFSMIFLINILRVILTIMHPSSPNPAPDSIRKAVRAALILTPLFGLQFIFIPVKPDSQHPMYATHQYISMIIISYQGLCCAILFCFANHEVHQAIKRTFQRSMNFQNTRSTNYQTAESAAGNNGHIQNGNAIPLLSTHRNSAKVAIRA